MNVTSRTIIETSETFKTEQLLQITVATLVVLGTLLLSMGQQNLSYALIALVGATTSLYVTDVKGFFRLSRGAASGCALVACAFLAIRIVQNTDQSQLLNVANILVFLQLVLLFQKKEDRTYWSLISLSLLQVIVAAALNLGLLFGLLLAVYLIVAIAALALFYVLRQTRPFLAARKATAETIQLGARHHRSDRVRLLVTPADDPARLILNGSYLQRVARMIVLTTLTTMLLFFAIPRFNNSVWQSPNQTQVATVGFTEEVRLNDISRILESPEQVMRAEFSTLFGNPYQIDGEPYFRGTVLSTYGDGSWRPFRSDQSLRYLTESPPDESRVVEQRITLQPGSHSVLFNVALSYRAFSGTQEGLRLNRHTLQLTRGQEEPEQRGPYRYVLATTAFRNGWQKDLLPVLQRWATVQNDPMFDDREDYRTTYPAITSTAEDLLAAQDLVNAGSFEKAKALEQHFRNSGLYTYALEFSRDRDSNRDPIDDFVGNHRHGHCEYFASALTLTLRSQQIPARMVVGYKGGDFNNVGNYYIVRQLHAHAWVEAYLPPNEIPEEELDTFDDRGYGAWLRLDPTPAASDIVATTDRFLLFTRIRELGDYCQVLWDDYVLGLNSTRQQQAIYGPLVRNSRAVFMSLFGKDAWRQRWREWQALLRSGDLFSWQAVLALIVSLVALFFLRKPANRLLQGVVGRVRARFLRGSRRRRLDVYDQLERVLARRGFKRQPQQTPFEFANATGGQLAEQPTAVHVAGVPRRVTTAYYHVRFGGEQLTPDQIRQLKLAVLNLEKALC